MSLHISDGKPVMVSSLSTGAIQAFASMGFDQLVTYGLQTTIALLTIVYLIGKIRNTFKNK